MRIAQILVSVIIKIPFPLYIDVETKYGNLLERLAEPKAFSQPFIRMNEGSKLFSKDATRKNGS